MRLGGCGFYSSAGDLDCERMEQVGWRERLGFQGLRRSLQIQHTLFIAGSRKFTDVIWKRRKQAPLLL